MVILAIIIISVLPMVVELVRARIGRIASDQKRRGHRRTAVASARMCR